MDYFELLLHYHHKVSTCILSLYQRTVSRILPCHQTDTKLIALISEKNRALIKIKRVLFATFWLGRSSGMIALNVRVNRNRIKNINIKHPQKTTASVVCPWWGVEGVIISLVWLTFVSYKHIYMIKQWKHIYRYIPWSNDNQKSPSP